MTILRILYNLSREIKNWDRASQIALAIALVLLVVTIIVLFTVPNLQTQATIGGIGLTLAIQAIVMWGNRNMVTPYTQAQRHFMAGEFEQAASVLETHLADDTDAGVDALVLLGNTYRNLGKLEDSSHTLSRALARRPNYHFALYGYAKTMLAIGDYPAAQFTIAKALEHGAPPSIQFDAVLAMYLQGDTLALKEQLQNMPPLDEPYRQLFLTYIEAPQDLSALDETIQEAGIAFWQAEAERFAHTPYGQAIAHETEQIKSML